MDDTFIQEKVLPLLTFNPGLALTGFRTTRPWNLLWLSRRLIISIEQTSIYVSTFPSAYEEKNNCCLSERLFRVKKNGVFLFGISFFVLEIFTFLYYK